MEPTAIADLPTWAKVVALVGVPGALSFALLYGLYRLAHALGQPLVKGVLEFLRAMIDKLEAFGLRLGEFGETLKALRENMDRQHETHEARFTRVESDLHTIKTKLETP